MFYCNDGDWTESCATLIEDQDGWLELLHWRASRKCSKNDRNDEDDNFQTPIMVLSKVS